MNSLRPLITITILAVVFAILYWKINEGPAHAPHGEAAAWPDHPAEGIPPLAATTNPSPAAGTAPAWPGAGPSTTTLQPAPSAQQPAPPVSGATDVTQMPAIPALPDVAPAVNSAPPVPLALPANIPAARYPDSAAGVPNGVPAPGSNVGAAVPANSVVPENVALDSVAAPQTPSATDHENAIATETAMAAAGLKPQAAPTAATPIGAAPSDAHAPGGLERYDALGGVPPVDPSTTNAAAPPVEPSFAGAWPEIQAALDRRELGRAHQLLSKWYGDETLTPAEAEKVQSLLNQLAGTVVYSTEHQLEPAYVVKPGDTFGSIAQQFNVPWQLLAKINGIPSADALQAGQTLKVVRGPFSAVVDLRRSQLTLLLGGCYAGKFPIAVPAGAALTEGQWLVDQKLAAPATGVSQTAYTQAPTPVERTIVLRGEDATTGQPVATGPLLTIAGGASSGPPASIPAIRVSPQDAEELTDILSIGSRVTIRK